MLANIERDIRNVIRMVFPSLPYPPHATDLNVSTAFLAAWMIDRKDVPNQTRPGTVETRLDELQRFVEGASRRNEHGYEAFVDACDEQRSWGARAMLPARKVLESCERQLAQELPAALDLLDRLKQEWSSAFRAYIQRLNTVFNTRPGRPLVVVGAASPQRTPGAGRYLQLFPAVVARVGELLASPDSGERVDTFVAEAPVGGANGKYVQLTDDAVEAAIADGVASVQVNAALPVWRDCRVASYRPHTVIPGVILADYCANRLCTFLGARTWLELCEGYAVEVPFPAELEPCASLGVSLPALAAAPERADRGWWGADQARRWAAWRARESARGPR
jgi:hypothetical protein